MIGPKESNTVRYKRKIDIDITKTIQYVSMRVYSVGFQGIRFLDQEGDLITEEIWGDPRLGGEWTVANEIPEGQKIIGLKALASSKDNGFIYDFHFVTGSIL